MDTAKPEDKTFEELLSELGVQPKPLDPNYDYTPIFWNGMVVGTRQDIIDGNLDPFDRSAWGP